MIFTQGKEMIVPRQQCALVPHPEFADAANHYHPPQQSDNASREGIPHPVDNNKAKYEVTGEVDEDEEEDYSLGFTDSKSTREYRESLYSSAEVQQSLDFESEQEVCVNLYTSLFLLFCICQSFLFIVFMVHGCI